MGSASSSVAYEVPAARDVDALQQLTDDLWGEQQISGKAVTRERIVGMAESRGVDRGYIESLELPAAVDGALLGSMRSGLLAVACDLDLGAACGGDGDVGEVPESLVSGTATAAEDGAAIEGATVVVSSREGLCGSAASDAGGRFEVQNVGDGGQAPHRGGEPTSLRLVRH